MKKVWFVLAMLVCGFASCNDGGGEELNPTPEPEVVTPIITIDSGILTNGLSFGTAEGESSISFSTNVDWILSVASTSGGSTWCTASVTSGSKGTVTVKFTVTENTEYDDRSVSVTIKAGTVSKTFTITQKGVDALLVTTDKYELSQEGGQIEIEVKANIGYEVEISVDWIKQVSESRTLKEDKLNFVIVENTSSETREGVITISSENVSQAIIVVQKGKLYLTFSDKEFEVMEGRTAELSYSTNFSGQFSWRSLDTNILTVSNEGIVTGINKGETTVIVSSEDGVLSDTCKVLVKSITDYISFTSGMSSIQIGSYVIRSISSTIKNTSGYDIELVSFAIYKSETGELYAQTTDASLLGVLKAGESKSLGVDNLRETFSPQYVWEYIFERARYRNNEKVAGSGTGSTGATGEDMPWQ